MTTLFIIKHTTLHKFYLGLKLLNIHILRGAELLTGEHNNIGIPKILIEYLMQTLTRNLSCLKIIIFNIDSIFKSYSTSMLRHRVVLNVPASIITIKLWALRLLQSIYSRAFTDFDQELAREAFNFRDISAITSFTIEWGKSKHSFGQTEFQIITKCFRKVATSTLGPNEGQMIAVKEHFT